jgi:hypothetical protein
MRRVEPDPDESRRKLWRAENSLTTHARCSPPGLNRIASLIGKIQACRPVYHSSGANGCFSICGGNAHPGSGMAARHPSEPFRSRAERDSFAALAQSPQFEHELSTSARPQRTALLDADPLFWDVPRAAIRITAAERLNSTLNRPSRPRRRIVGSTGERSFAQRELAAHADWSSCAFASFRSAVSKPSVNQP